MFTYNIYYIYSPCRAGQTQEYADCEPACRRRRLNGSLGKATGNHPIHIYSLDGVTPRFLINLSLDYSIA